MAPQILLLGATGYIGGTLLNHLVSTHPDFSITVLVRNSEHVKTISAAYPKITSVIGDLDSHETLVREAAKADIVIQSSNFDHEASMLSLADGVTERNKRVQQEGGFKPVLILISGSGNLVPGLLDVAGRAFSGSKEVSNTPFVYGEKVDRVYSDVVDAETIRNFGPERIHTAIEQKAQGLSEERGFRCVVLAPCAILGKGTGPVKTETFNAIVGEEMVKRGQVFTVGDGDSIWSASSVRDVAKGITFVVEEALKGDKTRLEFGWKGYYFIETFEVPARERAHVAASRLFAEGKINHSEVASLTAEEAAAVNPLLPILLGTSSRARADRLKSLGWKPEELDWKAAMAEAGAVRI
ncbi:MAG: hypothetical protein Q9227_006476 [Pyrenula ochraceoflavens]